MAAKLFAYEKLLTDLLPKQNPETQQAIKDALAEASGVTHRHFFANSILVSTVYLQLY